MNARHAVLPSTATSASNLYVFLKQLCIFGSREIGVTASCFLRLCVPSRICPANTSHTFSPASPSDLQDLNTITISPSAMPGVGMWHPVEQAI